MADLNTRTLFVICERPKLIENLQEEIISVLLSLSNVHLMDSVIKETPRINLLALRWRDMALDQEYKGHYYAIDVGCYK